VAAEDAGNVLLDNENADPAPDGTAFDRANADLEVVSFEVVAPPKEKKGTDAAAFPKLKAFALDLIALELVLIWPPPGLKLNMLLLTVVEVPNPE